ncbi:MAG: adenylosuccinate lyase [Candidatus Uhrbacteria bacterium]|nr:adenylosuccinate lyase [Candidatus Uhrbacteria bacterium]
MIPRYSSPEMERVWTDENKFAKWREVELAVLRVRERRGEIPSGTAKGIEKMICTDARMVDAIHIREMEIGHDLNAFVEVMRLQMIVPANPILALKEMTFEELLKIGHPEKWDHYFHEGMTSYDTEEPATALLFREADEIIDIGIERVLEALKSLAVEHRGTIMIGRTHGQWAQPVTFGKRCLDWFEMIERARDRLRTSSDEICVMKLSGAVGFYGTLGPSLEEDVATELDLKVADIATQILPLCRRAQHLNSLAELATVLGKTAFDLWLLSQSEIGEVREPFGKKQKGSSAMPHKKNPITLEKLRGLPRHVRHCAASVLECVETAHERDISHSSVERMAVPDAYGLTYHLLRQLGRVLEGLEVFPERMANHLRATCESYASQAVRDLLGRHGVPGETAYRFIQKCASISWEKKLPLSDVFLKIDDDEVSFDLRREIGETPEFERCFDPKWWVRHEAVYYKRFALNGAED